VIPRSIFSVLNRAKPTFLLVGVLALTACANPDPAVTRGEPYDPYEAENRRMHKFNKGLDRALVRPAGKGYSNAIPDDIEKIIGNFAANLAMPAAIVNNILQGNGKGATEDTYRFVVNTTLGLGGFFDAASDLNMPEKTDTDFGETLYTWGVNEGPYLELPLLGPATTRDTVGKTVDLLTNPLSYLVPSPERFYGTAAAVSSSLSNRGQYADTIDSILYESADSYAASQSIYLQNRRFNLGNGSSEDYLDPYDTGFTDPYEDSDVE